MPNYNSGKIYKIINDIDDKIYISTTIVSLYQRMKFIKASKGEKQTPLIKYMKSVGMEHFKIILIERFPCGGKSTLNRRREYHIRKLNPYLNLLLDRKRRNIVENNYYDVPDIWELF